MKHTQITFKTFLIFAAAALAGCNGKLVTRNSQAQAQEQETLPIQSTTECANGLTATVTQVTPASSVTVGQGVQFRIDASGCKYGYLAFVVGSADPLAFNSSATYTQTFSTVGSNIRESVRVVVLNDKNQAANQYTIQSAPFAVAAAPVTQVNCALVPAVMTVNLNVDTAGNPTQAPPNLRFTIQSSVPTRVVEVLSPFAGSLQLSPGTPIPSAVLSSITPIDGQMIIPRTGPYAFKVVDAQGNIGQCLADVRINPISATIPQFNYRGDFTGDGVDDILTREPATGVLWVAKGSGGSGFTYLPFGLLPPTQNYVDFLAADFNHDGKMDFIVRELATRMWKGAFSNGNAFVISDLGAWPANLVLSDVRLLDYNNNGMLDIVGRLNSVNYFSLFTLNPANPFLGSIAAPIPEPSVLSVQTTATTIAFDGSVTFNWTSTNTSSCLVKKNGTAVSMPSGSNVTGGIPFPGLESTSTFQLQCVQAGTSNNIVSTILTVVVQPPPAPVLTLKVKASASDSAADARVVDPNGIVYWSYSTQNAKDCQMFRTATVLSTALNSGYVASAPITANAAFILKCKSLLGVAVETPAIIVSVKADLSFAPSTTIDFGNVNFGGEAAAQTIVVTAAANKAGATAIKATLPANFVFVAGTCTAAAATPFVLAAGASCNYKVKFVPAGSGNSDVTYQGALAFSYHDGISTISENAVTLKGRGTKPPEGK